MEAEGPEACQAPSPPAEDDPMDGGAHPPQVCPALLSRDGVADAHTHSRRSVLRSQESVWTLDEQGDVRQGKCARLPDIDPINQDCAAYSNPIAPCRVET